MRMNRISVLAAGTALATTAAVAFVAGALFAFTYNLMAGRREA